MALPETPLPPQFLSDVIANLHKLVNATQQSAIATLAAAVISARGKPVSIAEVLEISRDLQYAMFPVRELGIYKEWEKTKAERVAQIHD
jgi:hypothetical protein